MKTVVFRFWQWTWGFPQSLLGLILHLIHRKNGFTSYHGCIVTPWNGSGSMGVGMYLFISRRHWEKPNDIWVHEFGHSVQSLILGPLFLPVMGLPSFLWCNLPCCRRLRKNKGISYYRFYPESTANLLGAWATGEKCNIA